MYLINSVCDMVRFFPVSDSAVNEGLQGGHVSLRRRGTGSGTSTALGYLVEVDHASYVLLTTHAPWATFP